MGYVDLLLMHWPGSPANSFETNGPAQGGVHGLRGAARKEVGEALGLSNFTQAHTEEILSYCTVSRY